MKAPYNKTENYDREYPDEKTHKAVCFAYFDIGKWEATWSGQTKIKHRVIVCLELEQRMEGLYNPDYKGKRFVVTPTNTFTLSAKGNLRPLIEGIMGKKLTEDEASDFEMDDIVGKSCFVSISLSEGDVTYTNVDSTMALPKEVEGLTPETDWSDPPDWIKKKIETGKALEAKMEAIEAEKKRVVAEKKAEREKIGSAKAETMNDKLSALEAENELPF